MDFDFKGYFRELQRRHVVKAGLAYLAISWVVVEVATAVLPLFEVSDVFLKGLVLLLAIGFPIWLIIAWVYDFSPEGIKKTEDVPFDPKVSAKKNWQLNRLIIGGLSIAVILLIANQFRMSSTMEQKPAMASILPDFTSSIAVLAFKDISPNQDQEWLSDGISIQILDRLGKFRDLKIINHRSSFVYKGKDISMDIIGQELGVAYVLDGSIQKVGDMFRTTVQLIDTRDGSQIWSETYDRKMEDALDVQDEIARVVADRLNLTLTYDDVRLRKVDPEAFELYLRALREFEYIQPDHMIVADSLIRESLDIDSEYAPAWSLLSGTTFQLSFYFGQLTQEEGVRIGLQAAKRAIELDSAYPVAMNWLSNWQWHNREATKSLKTLEKLLRINPNSFSAHGYAAHMYTRLGMPEKGLKFAYKGVELSPKNYQLYERVWRIERYMDNYPQASLMYNKFVELQKQQTGIDPYLDEVAINYFENGEVEKAKETLSQDTDPYWHLYTAVLIASKEGNKEEAENLLKKLINLPDEQIFASIGEGDLDYHYITLATLYASIGDKDRTFELLYKAWDNLLAYTENLWQIPEFKVLHDDPGWKELLDRLGEEFNYDYNAQ